MADHRKLIKKREKCEEDLVLCVCVCVYTFATDGYAAVIIFIGQQQ